MRPYTTSFTFLFVCVMAWGQGGRFTVELPDTIPTGTPFAVTFTLENAALDDFQAPDWGDFAVVSGPEVSSHFSSINGEVSRSSSYTYYLTVAREGTHTLPPASVQAEGQTLKTEYAKTYAKKGYAPLRPGGMRRGGDWFDDWFDQWPRQPAPIPPVKTKKYKKKTYRI